MSDWDDLYVIDADAHFTEPADLWSSRVPAGMQDRMPQLAEVDGRTGWFLDGEMWASTGGNTIQKDRQKVLGSHVVQPFADIDPSAWSVPERLALMDELGLYAQVIYPNGIGFASNHVFAIKDAEQRATVLRVYNDFLVDLQEQSGGRLLPQALLPVWDMDLTVREMTRLLDKGIRGFTLSDKPELLGLPELIQPYFAPMWDLFNDSGAVANFHIGAGARAEELNALRGSRYAEDPHKGGPVVLGQRVDHRVPHGRAVAVAHDEQHRASLAALLPVQPGAVVVGVGHGAPSPTETAGRDWCRPCTGSCCSSRGHGTQRRRRAGPGAGRWRSPTPTDESGPGSAGPVGGCRR
jgi:hypothetical protein